MIDGQIAEITDPSPDQRRQIDAQYSAAVQKTLTRALASSGSPEDIFAKMRGVFPSEVPTREPFLNVGCESRSGAGPFKYHPELHPLDYEWYFTNETARELGHRYSSKVGLTVCLGSPTVAVEAIRASRRVVFLDRNPCSLTRFPELHKSDEIHLMDAAEAARIRIRADICIFDSPWYLADTLSWLSSASRLVKRGGAVVFALFPPLVRAAASLERDVILELAASIGAVELEEDALVYETPLFEQEALNTYGLPNLTKWRRADIVHLTVDKPVTFEIRDSLRRPLIDGAWSSFVIQDQMIKVRKRATRRKGNSRQPGLLQPLSPNFILGSVSVSRQERDLVDVWTSRNRVALSSRPEVLSLIFRRLARGESINEAIRPYGNGLPPEFENLVKGLLAREA